MKTKRMFFSSLALLLLTACLVANLASCNLLPKQEGETTPATNGKTPDPYEGVEWIDATNIPIPEELKSTKAIMGESNEELYESSTRFQGKEYRTRCYDVLATALDFDKIFSASVVPEANGWNLYELQVAGQKYEYQAHFVEGEDNLQIFVVNPATGKAVEIVMIDEKEYYITFKIIYESGETEQVNLPNEYHNLSMMNATAILFPIAFEGEFDIEYSKESVKYRYNPTTGEFVEEE